jgi:hypothetical protein
MRRSDVGSTTISHFKAADNGHSIQLIVQPNEHFVLLSMNNSMTDRTARIAPKQARRLADALRVAAREAEENGRPRNPIRPEEATP